MAHLFYYFNNSYFSLQFYYIIWKSENGSFFPFFKNNVGVVSYNIYSYTIQLLTVNNEKIKFR